MCAQSCLTLCHPMDFSLPGSSVHRIFQARILEWVSISFLQGIFPIQVWTHVSCISTFSSITTIMNKLTTPTTSPWGFPSGSVVNNPPANAGDTGDVGSILGSGRPPGGGNVNPLQYSCLENSMDGEAWLAEVHGVARVGHNWAVTHRQK